MKVHLQKTLLLLLSMISTKAYNQEPFFITGDLNDLKKKEEYGAFKEENITVLTHPINEFSPQEPLGHLSLTKSVLRGFAKLEVPMNYNPQTIAEVHPHVIVLVNIDALQQCIELKKKGLIKTLIVGPNMLDNPNAYDHILGSPEIDWYIAPSEWIRKWCIDQEPLIKDKTVIWYAGVDDEYWQPNNEKKFTKTMMVYCKAKAWICLETEKIFYERGWNVKRVLYGYYSPEEFKEYLNEVDAAVILSESESQGIALAECWSMNIPTLAWNPQLVDLNGEMVSSHSAPYLTQQTGCCWRTFEELHELLNTFEDTLSLFTPRQWVNHYMSDSSSIHLLLEIIHSAI